MNGFIVDPAIGLIGVRVDPNGTRLPLVLFMAWFSGRELLSWQEYEFKKMLMLNFEIS